MIRSNDLVKVNFILVGPITETYETIEYIKDDKLFNMLITCNILTKLANKSTSPLFLG